MFFIINKQLETAMRVTREKAEENRERVIETAAILFRERGIDGIGIADLMKEAGLTHGGFYRQFESKDDLVVQAVKKGFTETKEALLEHVKTAPKEPLKALVEFYVSAEHSDSPGHGCCIAALGPDAARSEDPALAETFQRAVENYLQFIGSALPDMDPATKQCKSIAILSEMVGAVILSRLVQDPVLKNEILSSTRKDILEAPGPRLGTS